MKKTKTIARPPANAKAADAADYDLLARTTRELIDECVRALRNPTPLRRDEIDRLLDVRSNGATLVLERFLERAGFSSDEIDAMPTGRLDDIGRALFGTIGADHALSMIVTAEDDIRAAAHPTPTRH